MAEIFGSQNIGPVDVTGSLSFGARSAPFTIGIPGVFGFSYANTVGCAITPRMEHPRRFAQAARFTQTLLS